MSNMIIDISLNYSLDYTDLSKVKRDSLIYIEYDNGVYKTISPEKLKTLIISEELQESADNVLFELKQRNVKIK